MPAHSLHVREPDDDEPSGVADAVTALADGWLEGGAETGPVPDGATRDGSALEEGVAEAIGWLVGAEVPDVAVADGCRLIVGPGLSTVLPQATATSATQKPRTAARPNRSDRRRQEWVTWGGLLVGGWSRAIVATGPKTGLRVACVEAE